MTKPGKLGGRCGSVCKASGGTVRGFAVNGGGCKGLAIFGAGKAGTDQDDMASCSPDAETFGMAGGLGACNVSFGKFNFGISSANRGAASIASSSPASSWG